FLHLQQKAYQCWKEILWDVSIYFGVGHHAEWSGGISKSDNQDIWLLSLEGGDQIATHPLGNEVAKHHHLERSSGEKIESGDRRGAGDDFVAGFHQREQAPGLKFWTAADRKNK